MSEENYTFRPVVKDPGETLKVELDLFGKCANFRLPNEQYATDEHVRFEQSPGFAFKAAIGGTTGLVPPKLPAAIGQQVKDGSVTWECVAAASNGLSAVSSPSAEADPGGLSIENVSVSETTKILATYAGGTLGADYYDAVFTFTLRGVQRVARQRVYIRKR